MKRYLIVLTSLCFFNTATLYAQSEQRTMVTQIADLLARVPARDSVQSEKNNMTIAKWGRQGLIDLISMLADAGKGDNTILHYTLNGFSNYVMKQGKNEERNWCVNAYTQGLEKVRDYENKSFLIRELEIVGTDAAVPVLKGYLLDERLCDPAARALVEINTPSSGKALFSAFSSATGNTRISLIKALGDIRYAEAAPSIRVLVNNSDRELSSAAMYSLAHIADPASEKWLADAALKDRFIYKINNATDAYITYAQQLVKNGKITEVQRITDFIFKNTTGGNQVPARTAALKLLVDLHGEKSTPFLMNAMKSKSREYRAAALRFALAYTDNAAITQWGKQLNKSDNMVKQEIITMLGNAGNSIALPVVLQALEDKDEQVRLAAIKSSEQLAGEVALPFLLELMKKSDATAISAIASAILVMKGTGVADRVADVLPQMPAAEAQAALINCLSARRATHRIKDVLPFLESKNDTVHKAAFSGLKNMVKQDNLPTLYALLTGVGSTEKIKAVQEAIVEAIKSIPDSTKRIPVLKEQMNLDQKNESLFFEIFSGIGGKEGLNVMRAKFDEGNEHTRAKIINALCRWSDAGATAPLLQIMRTSPGNASYFDSAFTGYVRLVSVAEYTPEQKILMLGNAMDIAKNIWQKTLVLKEAEKCKTFMALTFAGKYIDDPSVQYQAADVVATIVLSDRSLNGRVVRDLLQKAGLLISGPDATHKKENIQKRLASLPDEDGFFALLNDNDISGWQHFTGNPILFEKMDAKEKMKLQKESGTDLLKSWLVKSGELIAKSNSCLSTKKNYGDFEMFIDWKIDKGAGAGIYLRGTPQVQISDMPSPVGSGGLSYNISYQSKPLVHADNAIGEWNTFHIIMKGDRVTVYLNGVQTTKEVILENYWDPNLSVSPEGPVALKANGAGVTFRNIYIREIPSTKPFVLSEEEKKEGFEILFDGTNMFQWVGNTSDFVMEEGTIFVKPKNWEHSNLYTKKDYSDFVFRFEFQLTPRANNGIGIRAQAPQGDNFGYSGTEIQILDDDADIYKNLKPYQYHGSVYGIIPAKRGFLNPTGEWNYQEISVIGSKIKIVLNGATIVDGDVKEATRNGAIDGRKHPNLVRNSGRIVLLGHGDRVKFRNIRIKEVK